MDNPIKSVMVYFDEKERRAILCVDDRSDRQRNLTPCDNSDGLGFHAHAWLPLGWMTEQAFCTSRHRHGLAAEFVHSTMFAVISIRDRYEAMERDREATLRTNEALLTTIRKLVGGLDGAICHIDSEEKRLEIAGLVYEGARHLPLTKAEPEEEAS